MTAVPPTTPEARAELIKVKLDAFEDEDDRETYRLEVQGTTKLLPVLSLPVGAVVLNPRSHRIQAELESHPKQDLIEASPYSDEAQEVISDLLRNTDAFEGLKSDLREHGQRQVGVVTRTGLLVNANRRTVALRDVESEYVRVAVLPPGLNDRDLDKIELQLQMSRDYFAEYTFTNRLKFIETWRTRHGLSDEKLARILNFAPSSDEKDLKKGAKEVQLEARLLTMIRDVQELSGGTIPLPFFNDKRQTLIDIDASYEKTKQRDPASALRVRNAKLITLFLGGTRYQVARKIEEDFFDDYFVPALEESSFLGDVVEALTSAAARDGSPDEDDLGLDVLGGSESNGNGEDVACDPQVLLTILSRSTDSDSITLKRDEDGAEVQMDRQRFVDELDATMQDAIEEFQADATKADKLQRPVNLAREAERKLERALKSWEKVRSDTRFDSKRLEAHLKKVERAARALREKSERHDPNGDS